MERELGRRRVLVAVSVLCCSALLGCAVTLHAGAAARAALFAGGGASLHEGSLAHDVGGLEGLGSEVDAAEGENSMLHREYTATFKSAPCTSLRGNGCSAKVVDNYLANIQEATSGDPNAGCCGEEGEGDEAAGSAPAAGDLSIGAVVKALEKKFRNMKQQFREVRADYYKGAPRDLTIKVSPRGPRGFTGPPGINGVQGVQGEQGGVGPVGPKGFRGYTGDMGPRGRKGKKGMTGSIGEAGDMGPVGLQGKKGNTGFPGPPGSKGLPGAAGVMGSNGKDGPPGPPGTNGVPGPPGLGGDPGPPGAPGAPGIAGPDGPKGSKGRTGNTGVIGPAGQDGEQGTNGVGPSKPGPVKKAGKGTWGPEYLKTRTCNKLGVAENLGGECKPLCESCDSLSGFMLVNEDGLRYNNLAFDDHNYGAGSTQAKNVCMLARYGNKGDMKATPDGSSYMALVDKKDVKEQVHFYGDCSAGSKTEAKCCTNAELMSKGFDFKTFATGGSCGGDLDKGKPTKVLFCVFDKAVFVKQSRPAGPPKYPDDRMTGGKSLRSNGKINQMNMLSSNGLYQLSMQRNGNLVVYKQGGIELWSSGTTGKGTGPYRLDMQTDGNLVIYDKGNKFTWASNTAGKGGAKLVMQNDGNLVLYSNSLKAVWSTSTAQTSDGAANIALQFSNAVCVGTACMTGALFSRMKTVSDGLIESGTGRTNLDCKGGPKMATVEVKFTRKFAAPPKVYLHTHGMWDCQHGHANFRMTMNVKQVTETFVKFEVGTWGDTRVNTVDWSYMAIGHELSENVQNYKSRNKKAGDESRGILCIGKYCAGETMLDRLITMANVHIQIGRINTDFGNCNQGHKDTRRINFERPFASAPKVFTSIYKYDLCWDRYKYNRAYSDPTTVDSKGFTSVAGTWGDTMLWGIGVEWMAISHDLMVRPQQYFPLVPQPSDPVANQVCFGNTCVTDADKWKDIMNMANWRFEVQRSSYHWHCHHRSATLKLSFNEAWEEVPEVKVFVRHFDECGFKSFRWSLDVKKVTTAGFEVDLYGYAMYSIGFEWVAYSRDLAPPPLPPPPEPKKQGVHKSSGTWGDCFDGGKGTLCDQLGVKENMCGKCRTLCPKCTGKEGFILENDHGLRWGPKELGFDDNRLSAGEYNGQNYCMLAKYGNKGKFSSKDFPSSRSYLKTASAADSQKHFYGNCRKGSKSEQSCCTNARHIPSGFDWSTLATGNSCSGDSDTDRPSKTLICYFDYDSYTKMKLLK